MDSRKGAFYFTKMKDSEIWKNKGIKDLPGEEWRDITGYEGIYMVSNFGRVKSLEREIRFGIAGKRIDPEKIKTVLKTKKGYNKIGMCNNGTQRQEFVHRLVALAFIPNPEGKPTVNHIDGNKDNNCLENLEWSTYLENNRHAIDTKLRSRPSGLRGSEHKKAILTESDVIDIRKMRENGERLSDIANTYSVSTSAISSIVHGRNWKHV